MDRLPIRRIIYGTSLVAPNVRPQRVQIVSRIESMLARPSWSVRSMLPDSNAQTETGITTDQLHHLLKLSALPAPKTLEAEQKMLHTLESQIHFVKEVQKVDTTGVEPLVAIRDETDDAVQEQTITLDKLQAYLDQEEQVGTNGTIRRRKAATMIKDSGWDPFNMGEAAEGRRKGKYFFVKKVAEQEVKKVKETAVHEANRSRSAHLPSSM